MVPALISMHVWLMTFSNSSSRLSSGIWGHWTHMLHRHICLQNTKGSISSELMTEQMNEQLSLHSAHRMVSMRSVRNKLRRITHMTNDQQTCILKPSTWNTMNCLGGHINTHGVVWQHPPHTHTHLLLALSIRQVYFSQNLVHLSSRHGCSLWLTVALLLYGVLQYSWQSSSEWTILQ